MERNMLCGKKVSILWKPSMLLANNCNDSLE